MADPDTDLKNKQPPYMTTDPKIIEWRKKISIQVDDVTIHKEP